LILLIIITSLLAVLAIQNIRYQTEIVKPYENFISEEKKTVSLFDTLNENIYQSLPALPPNSSLQTKMSTGIIAPLYEHGRWLRMEVSTDQTEEFILEYYTSFLLNAGWLENKDFHTFDNVLFYKETSCIEVTPPSDLYPHYSIEIWHDYRKQNFSPKIPSRETLSSLELGLTNIAACP